MGFSIKKAAGAIGSVAGAATGALTDPVSRFIAGNPSLAGSFGAMGLLGGKGGPFGGKDNPYANLPGFTDPVTDPAVDAMRARLKELNGQKRNPLQSEALPDKPQALTGNLKEFDPIRNRVSQRISGQVQEGSDALKRRFAAMGALNTGAAVKQDMLMRDRGNQMREEAMQDVDLAESQERQRRNEMELQRFDAQRESALGRNFNREIANADSDFKEKVFQFDAESKIGQLDLAYKASQMEAQAQRFNSALSAAQAGDKKGILGSIFGGSGPLGLF
jgi:hypothetical protein